MYILVDDGGSKDRKKSMAGTLSCSQGILNLERARQQAYSRRSKTLKRRIYLQIIVPMREMAVMVH